MPRKIAIICILLTILLCQVAVIYAGSEIPGRTKYLVNDYAGVIDDGAKAKLEKELIALKRDKGVELVVSTFGSIGGRDFESFAAKYAHNWRSFPLFENDKRMHIMLSISENKVRIGTGYGVDMIITPDVVSHMIKDIMLPEFSFDRYTAGIMAGTEYALKVFDESSISLYSLPVNLINLLVLIFTIAAIVFILLYENL